MIGDFILWLKVFIKQQTCIHDYRIINRKDNGSDYYECNKCERIK